MARNEQVRDEALTQLYGAGQRIGRTPASMAKDARRQSYDFTEAELEAACLFLEGQGFATRFRDDATGQVRFKITSKGILEYEDSH